MVCDYIYSLRMFEKIRGIRWSLPRQPWCWPHWLAWHPLAPNSFGGKVIWTWEGRNPQWCQSKSRLKVHKITLYLGPFLWAQDAWGVWELTWGMQLFALPQGHSLCYCNVNWLPVYSSNAPKEISFLMNRPSSTSTFPGLKRLQSIPGLFNLCQHFQVCHRLGLSLPTGGRNSKTTSWIFTGADAKA